VTATHELSGDELDWCADGRKEQPSR
jgi:hypothetical protein